MRETIKQSTPKPVLHLARDLRDGIRRGLEWPSATFHPWRRESITRLRHLKDTHKGERCFIIGNGPSLQNTDLSKLSGESTFGMNRIYLAFDEWGWPTSYLVSVNSLVIEQCAADFRALEIPSFFSWRSRDLLYPDPALRRPDGGKKPREAGSQPAPPAIPLSKQPGKHPASRPVFLHTTYTGPKFARDAAGRLWEGATVTYVCLQLAFHMGFDTVILIGVDHSFTTEGPANTTVISQGDDPNHFSVNYFGKGFRWQLPDLDTSEIGYTLARRAFEMDGRQVLDATVGGKLQVFEKIDYDSLF